MASLTCEACGAAVSRRDETCCNCGALTPLGKRRELAHRREFQRKGSCLPRTVLLLAGLGLLVLLLRLAGR